MICRRPCERSGIFCSVVLCICRINLWIRVCHGSGRIIGKHRMWTVFSLSLSQTHLQALKNASINISRKQCLSWPVQIIACISDPNCVFGNEAIGAIHVHVKTKTTLRNHHVIPAVTFKENMHPRSVRNICNLSVKPSCTRFQVCLSDCFCNRKRIIQVTCRHSNVINTNVL